MSDAVHSVRTLREATAQLNGEHRAFGDAIGTEKVAWDSTQKRLDHLSLKAVEVGDALGVLLSDHERYVNVVS
jgi:hypothetical protein